jgi:mycothiol system anti-sigma-R factor
MSRGCEHAVEYVYQYLDEEMTRMRRARIKYHLKKCVACDGAFAFESRLKAVIRERGRETPPPELISRLRALIQEDGPDSSGS